MYQCVRVTAFLSLRRTYIDIHRSFDNKDDRKFSQYDDVRGEMHIHEIEFEHARKFSAFAVSVPLVDKSELEN